MKTLISESSYSWAGDLAKYDYSLFISPRWIEALASPRMQPLFIDFVEDETVVAKIAGFTMGKPGGIRRKYYFYAGPALLKTGAHSEDSSKLLYDCYTALVGLAKKTGRQRVIQESYDYKQTIPEHPVMKFKPRNEYGVDLRPSFDELKKQMNRNCRKNAIRAEKEGFYVDSNTDPGFVATFEELLEETRTKRIASGCSEYNSLFIPYFSKDHLKRLVETGILRFYVIRKEQKVFGAMAVLLENKKAYGLYKGCLKEGYEMNTPTCLDYQVIRGLQEQGCTCVNFGGVPGGESRKGLHQYKCRIGCVPLEGATGSTPFLLFPYSMLNLLIMLCKRLPENKWTRRWADIW